MAGPKRKTSNRPGTPGLVLRALVLAVLWVAVNWWVSSHFGRSLTEIGTVNAVLVALAAILGLLPESEKQAANAEKSRFVERLVMRLLSPWVLAALVVVFLTVASFVSSVHVERGDVAGDRRVELYFDGKLLTADDLKSEQDYFRHPARTSYAGRTLTLQVAGFLPFAVEVKPWLPSVVALDELPANPGVLLVDLDKVSMSAGTLRFFCPEDGAHGSGPFDFPTAGVRGPVALGAAGEPDADTLAAWADSLRSRLRAQGIGNDDIEALLDVARQVWSTPVAGPDLPCLQPGLNLRAVLCTPLGKPAAMAELQVEARSIAVELARSNLPADADAWCAGTATEPADEDPT